MHENPTTLSETVCGNLAVSILEWNWPDVVDYTSREERLSIEMSIAPFWSAGTASYPDLDAHDFCPMGRVFVRFPGHAVRGRAPGGTIRLLRCMFDEATTQRILANVAQPHLGVLKRLLDITDPQIRAILDILHDEVVNCSDGLDLQISSISRLLEIYLGRVLSGAQASGDSERGLQDWKFVRIKEAVEESRGRVSVADLARRCDMSERHLQRLFKRMSGESLSSFRKSFWVGRARELLAREDLSVSAAGEALGFSSTPVFSRAFCKATGNSPSMFRKMLTAADAGPVQKVGACR